MAINFLQGQVAVSDPNPGGPSAISNIKAVVVTVVKLTSVNFTSSVASNLVAVLPADATILNLHLWTKVQLAGGGITGATLSLGTSVLGSQFVAAINAFNTAGVSGGITPISNIMQNYNVPYGPDIQVYATGTAVTGNPTSGEMYVTITYTR